LLPLTFPRYSLARSSQPLGDVSSLAFSRSGRLLTAVSGRRSHGPRDIQSLATRSFRGLPGVDRATLARIGSLGGSAAGTLAVTRRARRGYPSGARPDGPWRERTARAKRDRRERLEASGERRRMNERRPEEAATTATRECSEPWAARMSGIAAVNDRGCSRGSCERSLRPRKL
jgi:hypothetical protein